MATKVTPEQKLKDAITHFREHGEGDLARLTGRILAVRLNHPYSSFRQSLSSRKPPFGEETLRKAENLLRLQPNSLSNGKPWTISEFLAEQYPSAPGSDNVVTGEVEMRVYRGGSADVWAMSELNVEILRVFVFNNTIVRYVKVDDSSLRPLQPGMVIGFQEWADRTPGQLLLIQSKRNPEMHACREFDGTRGAKGEFVDIHGGFAPLDISEWTVIGAARTLNAPGGFSLKNL